MVSSAVLFVPFARTGSHRGPLAVFGFGLVVVVLGGEGVERPVVRRVLIGSHVLAESVAVDVVRTRTGYQFVGYVVDVQSNTDRGGVKGYNGCIFFWAGKR